MNRQEIIATLKKLKVIPVTAIDSADLALPLADALMAGGLPLIEITFRTRSAGEVIAKLKKERKGLLVGAGTILTAENLKTAIDSGAEFGVSPGLNPDIVKEAKKLGLPFFPGVMTPGEIEKGLSLGENIFKYFPSEAAGGTAMLKAVYAPYSHLDLKFIPTGGVNLENLRSYLELKSVLAVGGTMVAGKEDIASKQWDKISDTCRKICGIVDNCRTS